MANIRQLPSGLWQGTIRLRSGKRITYTHERYKAVAEWDLQTRAKIARGAWRDPGAGKATLAQMLESWLERGLPAAARSTNTVDNYAWAVHHHLIPALGRVQLRDLSPDDVEDMLRAKAKKDKLSRSSLARIHGTLKRALRWAERRGMVDHNVALLVDTPDGPVKKSRALTVEQARALLEAARGERLEALFVVALLMGLRPGELKDLTWDDIDTDAGVLWVRTSQKRERDEHGHQVLKSGETKTPTSRRGLDIPALAIEVLRAHRRRQAAERLAAGPAWSESGLVFATQVGTRLDPSNLRRYFANLTKRAGIGHWSPRELRHSCVSILCAAGVPLEQVSDVVGHAGSRVTASVYRHQITPTVSAGKAVMDELFGPS